MVFGETSFGLSRAGRLARAFLSGAAGIRVTSLSLDRLLLGESDLLSLERLFFSEVGLLSPERDALSEEELLRLDRDAFSETLLFPFELELLFEAEVGSGSRLFDRGVLSETLLFPLELERLFLGEGRAGSLDLLLWPGVPLLGPLPRGV